MIRYTLRQLEYFVAVTEAGSVARAAHHLNVTQPTVSAAIAKLEDQLGIQLLVRQHAQGVSPTPEGRWLVVYARNLLEHAREIERQSAETTGTPRGTLELASYMTLAPAFLPGLVSQFTRISPKADIRIHEAMQGDLIEGLRDGRYHLALLYDVDLPDDVTATPLAAFSPHVLLPDNHRLTADDHGIAARSGGRADDPARCATEPRLLSRPDEGPRSGAQCRPQFAVAGTGARAGGTGPWLFAAGHPTTGRCYL